MKKLENYILDNIESFNSEEPSLKTKKTILTSINKKKSSKWKWAVAAAIVIIVFSNLASFGYGQLVKSKIDSSISQAVPDFKNADKYYSKQISVLKKEIQKKDAKVDIDFDNLDTMIEELKDELSYAPNLRKKQLAKKIIAGYKKEINLLKKITLKINIIS